MKKAVFIFLIIILFLSPVYSQLNVLHNHLRAGDLLFKQQVEYVDPGQSGANCLWNFSSLKTINDEYILEYDIPPWEGDSIYVLGDRRYRMDSVKKNELIIGTEHNTMYYYHQTEDCILQNGHENPSVVLSYTSPLTLLRFPLNYGDRVFSAYKSKGLYSGTVDIRTEGTVTVTADAYGKMILPSKDTLGLVLRVKTQQTIFDIPTADTEETANNGKQLEIHRWYSKGYRYPIFETLRSVNLSDSSVIFSTAFFFPPQDHLYLDTDSANLALLDELWDMENYGNSEQEDPIKLKDIVKCRIYPNPVNSILNIEYELTQDVTVGFQLYTITGLPVKAISPKKKSKGRHYETLDCSSLQPQDYILRITANDLFTNEVIIKN